MSKPPSKVVYTTIIKKLKSSANPEAVAGMARYGINPKKNYGISVTTLRKMAWEIGRDHQLAQKLWKTGIRDARILAASIDDPQLVSEKQMEQWVTDIDSWDVCDHCCGHLFDKTQFAYKKAVEWSIRSEPFVKRAGFSLIAWLSVHDKKADDKKFLAFLPVISRESIDNRNYVKKAVNWALRQIGKRNQFLNRRAIETATQIQTIDSKSAQWIAADAFRELTSPAIQKRVRNKK
ncbi:DNA alkylation repair protein [candidate division TA06 bacterium DG_78]|uniref:DNA alkylation repair protein n=1 Tax=candidate division TA06 bacterium DG_78 TaxID=1703772 RepID=A0A0S7YG93_UNCT6|nr:MAG: DNA alkylation repair protein [candidate division TA06 bacterium DG_78]